MNTIKDLFWCCYASGGIRVYSVNIVRPQLTFPSLPRAAAWGKLATADNAAAYAAYYQSPPIHSNQVSYIDNSFQVIRNQLTLAQC